ncbi:hypothetical protein HPP92_005011 [Vanilla planifolia]|uniref:DUF3741 domain-containing protein n=1 Tax=Vanilla planifolia TaxID=51239 RepID=A0A835RT09_VANPL|nr:hypothetical protein HPP92_005011 [Vanilla planifolia]
MINLFDLSISMAGNKLFNEKANHEGSTSGRNRSDAIRKAIDPTEVLHDDVQDKTPMKMLIAQEMSRDMENKRKTPNVIAKLMGLEDSMPAVTPIKRNIQHGGSFRSHSVVRTLMDHQLPQVGYSRRSKSGEFHSYDFDNKDYDISQESRERQEKRMSLVREKFMEAKRLARDEKLLESKEFHDALEILNSNRELFLKFLEEPNSLFAKDFKEVDSIRAPAQAKRITVLKPSKTVEGKSENQLKQHKDDGGWERHYTPWSSNVVHHPRNEKLSQPTRIVILKPSPRKHSEMKGTEAPIGSSPEPPKGRVYHGGLKGGNQVDSRELAKQITLQMCESLSRRHRQDESLLSSVFSNGYVGDDSSFNGSDGCAEEEDNYISDSEIASSWDYTCNRYGSPYSHSSLSRDCYSPESSVIREAKKRLSERWTLVATNGLYQEKLQERSSSTLGEMLAIRELKRENRSDVRSMGSRSCGREEDFSMPGACLSIVRTKDDNGGDGSNCHLARSKSVPSSSSTFDNISSNSDEITKPRSGKTSFKGRVSSLFFSKNRKGGREKSASSSLESSQGVSAIIEADIAAKKHEDSGIVRNFSPGENFQGNFEAASGVSSSITELKNDKQDETRTTTKVTREEPEGPSSENQERITEKFVENQDHPSPTSILDAPFADDSSNTSSLKPETINNSETPLKPTPIESIARTLSWDDSCSEASSPSHPFKLATTLSKAGEHVIEDLLFAQNLLSASGLFKNRPSFVFDGWHMPDTPLDSQLLDKLLDRDEEDAKSRRGDRTKGFSSTASISCC